jgi:hypothetical protein
MQTTAEADASWAADLFVSDTGELCGFRIIIAGRRSYLRVNGEGHQGPEYRDHPNRSDDPNPDRSSVMTNTKTLMLAAVAALSLGVGTAMAQESAGGYIAGPFEQRELLIKSHHAATAPTVTAEPQYGSSDRAGTTTWPVLQGADGNGG